MGVVNVTPDSFSDGGNWLNSDKVIAHGLELASQGADISDVGGESTRPGAQRVAPAEELSRVLPVVEALAQADTPVSIDTMRAEVASRALAVGATMVNDVSGGLADPDMAAVIADAGVPYIVMHWRGHSADMYRPAVYGDVVAEVQAELTARVQALLEAGVDRGQLILDPGLGFAKLPEHNWRLLTSLDRIARLPDFAGPFPVLVAASRKGFLGKLLAGPDGQPRSFSRSDDSTIAVTALAVAAGAWCVRVHSVPGNVDAVRVATQWRHECLAGAR
ncbi:MAG TPA: dihydropteroate synthase [Streptosporangiaceae bacterium]|nr:dihydropteroate synthase [Streptosporangiaceae bacterium]